MATRQLVFELVNNATKQAIGEIALLDENLSNTIDVGKAIFDNDAVDQYIGALYNLVGRMVFDDKKIQLRDLGIYKDSWEFGSIAMRVRQKKLPDAVENETWELQPNTSYDVNLTHLPQDIDVRLYNKRVCFEIDYTIAEIQVKESFQNAQQLGNFISMIVTNVDNSVKAKINELQMRLVNNFIGETVYAEYAGSGYNTKSGIRAINLLKLFNDQYNAGQGATPLAKADAIYDPDFLRFAAYKMGLTIDRLKDASELFNLDGATTWANSVKCVVLSEFDKAAGTYLYNDKSQFGTEFIKLPEHTVIPFWQGSGTSYAFADTSKIKVTDTSNHATTLDGILAIAYDDADAMCVACLDRHSTSNYNPKAEFYNTYDKSTMGLFANKGANFVVFFIA